MFVRNSFAAAASVAIIVGAACKDPIVNCSCTTDRFGVDARGALVVPATTDTTPRAAVSFNTVSLAYSYHITTRPAGTIDSIALYQVASRDSLPASAAVILCAGVAACASTSGIATLQPPATVDSLTISLRSYGAQLVFFTTTAQKAAGGAMRGTMYTVP